MGRAYRSFDSAQDWLSPGRFALLLAAFIFAAYPDVVVGRGTFIFRDFGGFAYPLAFHHRESFWRGEIPLWNPLSDCGVPFLAQWNTLVLYPGSLLYLYLPLTWSLSIFCLLHQFIGGIGAYLLAHRWTENRLAAAVAGTAFAFNGLTLNSMMWPAIMAALAWMPWIVLTVTAAWQEGGRKILAATLFGTLQMLTGAPELILATWLLTTALLLAEWRKAAAESLQQLARFTLVMVLVGITSAAQLLPFLELLAHSQRDQSYSDASWAMPGWGWANLLVPQFYTFVLSHGVKFQYSQGWTSSYYMGIGTLALALFAVWRAHIPKVWALGAVSLLALILALGNDGPLYGPLHRVFPLIAVVRFPVKFVLALVFAVPFLAAWGIDSVTAASGPRWNAERIRLVSLWVVLSFMIVALVWFAAAYPQMDPPYSDWPATLRSGASRAVFLAAILGIAVILRSVTRPVVAQSLQIGLVLLVWLDVWTHGPDQSPRVSPAVYAPGVSQLSPAPRPGVARALFKPNTNPVLDPKTPQDIYASYLCSRMALAGDLNLLDGIPKTGGFYPLELREYSELNRQLYATQWKEPLPLIDFLGVSHMSKPDSFFDWSRRTNYLPMITSGQEPVFADAATTLAGLTNSTFDPRRVVYLPREIEPQLRTRNPVTAHVSQQHFSANRIDLVVETPDPTILVVAQAYFPAWRALVDGQPKPVWCANHAFQAVEVPAGTHQVILAYKDRAFGWGLLVSVVTLLCLGGLVLNGHSEPLRDGPTRLPST